MGWNYKKKPYQTPIGTGTRLDEDTNCKSVNEKQYRGVGSLLYLTASRPDIAFSVVLCARFQSNAKESHFTVVKRILRYLKGSDDLWSFYHRSDIFDVVSYSGADYAGDLDNAKAHLELSST